MRRRRWLAAGAVLAVLIGIVAWRWWKPPEPSQTTLPTPEVVATFETVERGALVATPAVTEDSVFVAAIRDTGLQPTGAILCLDRGTLKPRWTFDDNGSMLHMFSSPVIAGGRLYVGEGMHANFACHLYCLDAATGRKLWAAKANSHIESTPVVANGRVVIGAGDDGVLCFDARSGERLWRMESPAHVDTSPVIADGVVYAGSGISRRVPAEPAVFALDLLSGQPRWRVRMNLPVWATPTLADGTLFVGLGNGRLLEGPRPPESPAGGLVALNAQTGEERWRYSECDAVFGQPAVDANRIYVGSRDGRCHALDRATGRRVWATACGSPVVAGPVWCGSTLVVTASGGQVWGLNPTDGSAAWRFDAAAHSYIQPRLLSPPAVTRQDGRELLYLPAELQTRHGNAAVLYVLKP